MRKEILEGKREATQRVTRQTQPLTRMDRPPLARTIDETELIESRAVSEKHFNPDLFRKPYEDSPPFPSTLTSSESSERPP